MKPKSHIAILLAASLALALGACSSSSDDPPMNGGDGIEKPDPAIEQRAAIKTAIGTASSAVAAVDDDATDGQVTAAENAIAAAKKAIMDAADVPAAEKEANTGTVNVLASRLMAAKESRKMAMDDKKAEEMKAMTAKAKALRMAIMGGGHVAAMPMSIPAFDLDGDGDGTTNSDALTLKAGASPGSLGSWKGMDYGGMAGTGDAKTTGMTRIYSNMEAAKSVGFLSSAGKAIHGLTDSTADNGKDDFTVTSTASNVDMNIASPKFPTTGTTTYTGTGREFTGTYMGASGTYMCTGDTCTAAAGGDAGITLAGTWTFTPNASAMLMKKDTEYLYFGWWVRKDSKGMATHAGALYGSMPADMAVAPGINSAALVGKASYMGKSAGKFAISDPLRPANDDAGHFTADAELMADFKATGSTLSGTIDNFRLNDGSDDPGWSVELQKAMYSTDKFATADTPSGDQTVWSIGGNKSAASGMWEAQMYDEKMDDGSNVPTSVVGSFMSSISNTHEMVGAFGATKQ